jgi:hypothetical protein
MPTLHMRDFLTINKSDIRYPKKSTDSNSLLVKAHATHSGTINGNYRFYRPDSMQKACHTWVPDNTARRPVIINHNEHSDVLGRVVEAKYIDESYKWSTDYPIIKDSLFYKTDGKKTGLFESVDWVVDNLVPIKDYTGLGYIELGLKISNPEAIEKVLRDEYLTVSVGFTTDSAICSICHQDWASDDKCEHLPGEKIDGKRAYLICGPRAYDEVSFVNFPADPFASVFSKELLKDNLNKLFFLGQPDNQRNRNIAFSDSLFTDDITHPEGNMDNLDTLISEGKFDEILTAIKSDTLDAEKALELKAGLHEWNPDTDELKTKKRSLVSTLNAQIRKKDLIKKVDTADTIEADAEVLAAITDTKVSDEAASSSIEIVSGQDSTETSIEVDKTDVTDKLVKLFGITNIEDSKDVLGLYTKLDEKYAGSEADDKAKMRGMHSAVQEHWYADDHVAYMKTVLASKDMVAISNQDLIDKEDAVNSLSDEVVSIQKSLDGQKVINQSLLDTYKKALATQIVVDKITKGHEGYVNLDEPARKDKVNLLAKRHVEYLKDTVADILAQAKFSDITPVEITQEVGLPVSDNVSIDGHETTTTTATTDTKHVVELPRYLNSYERKQFLLQRAYDAAKVN